MYRHQKQRHWLQALEEAFRFWEGVPEQVLVDNARALVTLNNPRTGELVINPTFAAFAQHWVSPQRPAGHTDRRPRGRTSVVWGT